MRKDFNLREAVSGTTKMKRLLVFCLLLGVALAKKARVIDDIPGLEKCGECNPDECVRPSGCTAGQVKDRCGCCDVCGKGQYELCYHDDVPVKDGVFLGRCGDNLECRIRNDLDEGEEPEAICYCRIQGTLCGSDNKTYENLCALMAQGVSNGGNIIIKSQGPCDEAPTIVSAPENVKNGTGSSVALICEARGYPIPTIEWTWTRVDGKTVYLPSDDLRVSVNMRGGPEKWQVTGWLQILDLHKEHEGDYTCVAQNKHGMAEQSARINVESEKDIGKKVRSGKFRY